MGCLNKNMIRYNFEESSAFKRLRMAIGANHEIDLPWEPGRKGWTTRKKDGVELVIKPTYGKKAVILDLIHVDCEKRKQGKAKEALNQFLEQVKRLEMICYLFVSPDNASAWCSDPEESKIPKAKLARFYRKLGFENMYSDWYVFRASDHKDVQYSKYSSSHRHPKKISGLRELKQKIKDNELGKGTYSNGKDIWSVDSRGIIHNVAGAKPEFDWHRMDYGIKK